MKRSICCMAAVLAFALSRPATASLVTFAVDIDSTRLSGSDTSAVLKTQPGFTSWDLTTLGTSSTTLTLDGITFQIFGLAGSNQSRTRTTGGGGGASDSLLTDFVYNEGAAGRAIGLRITGLDVGTYSMQSWHYDSTSTVTSTENFIKVEVRNQGGAATTLLEKFPFGLDPASFSFDVTAPGQVKEIVFREDDAPTATDATDQNRARLNGFVLVVPEPASASLVLLAAAILPFRRRR